MATYRRSWCAIAAKRVRLVPIPQGLAASAKIDLLHLVLEIRPAIRIMTPNATRQGALIEWAVAHGWFAAADGEGFMAISRSPALSRKVLEIDRRSEPHTRELGIALGYPRCCCAAASRRGESGIDTWAAEAGSRRHVGLFRMIDPSGYLSGHALLSHIPCNSRCRCSLAMAKQISAGHARIKRLGSRFLLVAMA